MTGLITLSNFLAFNAQVVAIVAAAALLLRLVPLPSAGGRYVSWRLALALSLVAPWLLYSTPEPQVVVRDAEPAATVVDSTALPLDAVVMESLPDGPDAGSLPWRSMLAGVLIAGAVLRAIWLAAGVRRLRALRRDALPADDGISDELQSLLGTRAAIGTVPELTQPVTFGLWRPVVLLPETMLASPESMRRAVLAHELLHVQRRDWCWIIAEELLCTVLWFQPAVWWAVSRIELAREQVVDELAVLATGNRRGYIEALVACADGGRMHPAPAFARRTNLFTRVVGLSGERVMTSSRLVASGVAVIGALVVIAWSASAVFPVLAPVPVLEAAAPPRLVTAPATVVEGTAARAVRRQTEPSSMSRPALTTTVGETPRRQVPSPFVIANQADLQRTLQVKPITPENPIPRRVSSVPLMYPAELREGYRGTLVVRVVVDASGAVADVRRVSMSLSNPLAPDVLEALRLVNEDVINSVRLWRYQPPAEPPIAFYVTFTFNGGSEVGVSQSESAPGIAGGLSSTAAAAVIALERRLTELRATEQALATRLGERHPDRLVLRNQIAEVEAALDAARSAPSATSLTGPGSASGQPVRVGGNIKPPQKVKHVAPDYPPIALSARVQGVVIVETVIDEQGRVATARILRSIPLLDQAALDAVKQWEFSPTIVNGVAVPVTMTVTVQFSLNEQTQF